MALVFLWLAVWTALPITGRAERLHLPTQLRELGYETVPLRRTGQNHWFLFGQIEGRKRSCLVDTGWSFTTISTNTAGRLQETHLIRTLQLGSVTLTNIPTRASELRVNGQPTGYDMVLGCDFLLRSHAIIDCDNNRLFLRTRPSAATDWSGWETILTRAGWTNIALQERSPAALTCSARIHGQATELLVDSGAMWSCLDQTVATRAGLPTRMSAQRMTGPGANRQRAFQVAELKSWTLGPATMPERTFAVFALGDWGLGAAGKLFPEVGGILGGAELKSSAALIDCGNRRLWLRLKR
ncbi:MAG: pepsin/retropepsin-like aspartic protease family protein [Verrucomicrobiota bacterium]